ncbi:integrase domain-containing protein [uncultured Halomonas sp.]|uniref:integrase domain-containing protein n=1 Tax=uncultured Halomonas sp. TaxID=173971 RepID=UPI0026033110|nr:integrase domain-containing protein [uncultured Halomonas sp.]
MAKAAVFAANAAVQDGAMGFKHAAGIAREFKQFAAFAKANGVKQMEYVTRELVTRYGEQLADRVSNHEIGQGQAQNAVSAINSVMRLATQGEWKSVSPTRECGIDQRSAIRETPPTGLDRAALGDGLAALSERGQAIAELAREFGLRTKETSLLNAQTALREAQTRGAIRVSDGTKGGRPRDVPLNRDNAERQLAALERAAAAQGAARAVMPADRNWKQWSENGLRAIRETLQQHGVDRLHDLRSAYACERYQQLTGHAAPVLGGQAPRGGDRAARLQIAHELGHGRSIITNSYLGASI